MRQCWNWQTGTFEGRVSLTYGFKSRLPHHIGETKWMLTSKSRVFTGFFHVFQSKNFSVKPWMLFHDFHRPEGFEPSTNEYCQIKRQALSRFRSRLAFFYEKTFTKFRRLFCQISRNVINDKAAFFYFSRKDVIPMWQMYYIKRKQNERRKSQ